MMKARMRRMPMSRLLRMSVPAIRTSRGILHSMEMEQSMSGGEISSLMHERSERKCIVYHTDWCLAGCHMLASLCSNPRAYGNEQRTSQIICPYFKEQQSHNHV